VSALFWLVVRWIAAMLIGVAVGSAAAALAFGWVTMLIGAVALLLGGAFLFASVLATNASVMSGGRPTERGGQDLVGAGLLRATLLGFLGAGVLVGSMSGNEFTAVTSAVTGTIAILRSLGAGPDEYRRVW
jgi:hypothetical protein